MEKIESRKIVPIAEMISAGKSKLLNVILNINFVESRNRNKICKYSSM